MIWTPEHEHALREAVANRVSDQRFSDESGFTYSQVRKKRRALGLETMLGKNRKNLPEGYSDNATKTLGELRELYSCGNKALAHWDALIGYNRSEKRKPKPRPPVRRRSSRYNLAVVKSLHHDASMAGRAADYLKRLFKPVCRMTVYDPKADANLYRVGSRTMTSGEMIDLAEGKGFDPQEWARVA